MFYFRDRKKGVPSVQFPRDLTVFIDYSLDLESFEKDIARLIRICLQAFFCSLEPIVVHCVLSFLSKVGRKMPRIH